MPTIVPQGVYLTLVGAFVALIVGMVVILAIAATKHFLSQKGSLELEPLSKLMSSKMVNAAKSLRRIAGFVFIILIALVTLEFVAAIFR